MVFVHIQEMSLLLDLRIFLNLIHVVPFGKGSGWLENNVFVSRVRNPLNFHGSSLSAGALAQAGAPSGHGH